MNIWNLATPDIDVYVDIEDHDIDVFVDIEYSNLVSYTENYRDLQQNYRDVQESYRTRDFEVLSLLRSEVAYIGTEPILP